MTASFAYSFAYTAADAFSFIKEYLVFGRVRFGIVTPYTGKGTAFEKHRGAYARTVGGTEALDVENFSFHLYIMLRTKNNFFLHLW